MFKNNANKTVLSIYKPVELPINNNDELALELDVEAIAKQAARQNIPDSTAREPDSNELNLCSKLENDMLQAQNRAEESVGHLRDAILMLSAKEEINAAYELSNEFDKHLSSKLSTKLEGISAEKERYQSVSDDLHSFKKKNELRRMHHYPDSQYSTYAFFIIAIIIESILNGVFFAEGSDAGLIGGVSTALIISLFNVFFGGAVGAFALRYKNHYQHWKVVVGWIGVSSGMIISVILNLLVSHYRTAMILDPDNAALQAVETFREGILSISDVKSWLLFLLGILFYLGAVYKGYKADDVYPGYGSLARKRDKQYGYLSDDKSSADDTIQEAHEYFVENLASCFKSVQLKSKQVNDFASGFEQQKTILKSYHKHLEKALKYIITLYRDVNVANRSSDKPIIFKQPIDASLDYKELEFDYKCKRDELHKDRERLAEDLSGIRQKLLVIREQYQDIVNKKASV
ncbi:hypothetical protein BJAS_P3623 [Bathymodiolus japonicus methanotrophic gill symbiont]|uniref:hypothetical protein n=1 Tax=Bathymodiolus japonicus methanotrophic gill symbiont TaxID=113269 RepID=UPI001B733A15|nr:hypothetical protein [Bathymodiolus japonicus methanotrophic gill symbiont]GFO73048.1 hypothetical protein BJAS_P3623 [Bathymodiolus japonicus methanotrophic gill symbiont]